MKDCVPHGEHLLHFHADKAHFSLTAVSFVREALQQNMRVQYRLSPLYKFHLLTAMSRWGIQIDENQFSELPPYLPHPEVIRKQTLTALNNALDAKYDGLWLLLWVPEIYPNYGLWLEAEDVWTDLSKEYPITVLCSFCMDMNEAEYPNRVPDMFDKHTGYYLNNILLK